MHKNTDEAPVKLFDWLSTNDFASLDAGQKAEVLLYFSPEEYDEMREAMKAIARPRDHKRDLLDRFDQQHRHRRNGGAFVLFLKAAAVCLPALLSALAVWYLKPAGEPVSNTAAVSDTVYVTREVAVAPVEVHDTVYRNVRVGEKKSKAILDVDPSRAGSDEDIYVVPLTELQNVSNAIKGNSMRDDSLWRRFSYRAL